MWMNPNKCAIIFYNDFAYVARWWQRLSIDQISNSRNDLSYLYEPVNFLYIKYLNRQPKIWAVYCKYFIENWLVHNGQQCINHFSYDVVEYKMILHISKTETQVEDISVA